MRRKGKGKLILCVVCLFIFSKSLVSSSLAVSEEEIRQTLGCIQEPFSLFFSDDLTDCA